MVAAAALSLVKRLAQLHAGTVEACSDGPGLGSEFVVRFPALHASSSPGLVLASNESSATSRPLASAGGRSSWTAIIAGRLGATVGKPHERIALASRPPSVAVPVTDPPTIDSSNEVVVDAPAFRERTQQRDRDQQHEREHEQRFHR